MLDSREPLLGTRDFSTNRDSSPGQQPQGLSRERTKEVNLDSSKRQQPFSLSREHFSAVRDSLASRQNAVVYSASCFYTSSGLLPLWSSSWWWEDVVVGGGDLAPAFRGRACMRIAVLSCLLCGARGCRAAGASECRLTIYKRTIY